MGLQRSSQCMITRPEVARNNEHLNLTPFLDKQHDITDGMPGLIVSGLYAY